MGGSAAMIAAPIVGNVVGGLIGGGGATQAGNTAAQGAYQGQQTLQQNLEAMKPYYTPYVDLGKQGVSNISNLLNTGYLTNQFNNQDLNANLAPNYAFQLGQGQQATAQMQNASGGAMSGNTAKALQDYTQNYAGTAYQNAFSNYQNQRGNISAIDIANANLGLAGATGSANATLGTSTNIANLGIGAANATAAGITGSAAANAAGTIGASNAYGGAINNLGGIGYSSLQSMMNPSTNNGGSYSDFGAGAGQAGNSGFTPTAGNSFTFSTGG